jgi:hypothetical protein
MIKKIKKAVRKIANSFENMNYTNSFSLKNKPISRSAAAKESEP